MMMTQDRANHPLATPTSPRNLNPSAPAFRQGQAAPTSPQNLNPSAPAFHHSAGEEKSPTDSSYSGAEARTPGLLTNGDINANGTNCMVPLAGSNAGMPSGAGAHPAQSQGPQSTSPMGLALAPHPLLTASPQSSLQLVAASQQQQPGCVMGVAESLGGQQVQQQVQASSQNLLTSGTEEADDSPPAGGAGVDEVSFESVGEPEELEGAMGGQEYEYPDEVLAPIRKQMQFYFSNENLPNDKFLNQHMDSDKFIPLELFLDFGRIKPICNSLDQLIQAVESSSILELSEDRKRVRVSQCRKTLTLRGFPVSATEEDVRQFILEMGAAVPTHIEFVMYKEKYSVWYVSFKDETAALNSFFQFHNQKAVYKDHNIGCCIKSSGTLAAAGYFPSSEESNQRRMAHHSQAAAAAAAVAAAPVHTVQSAIPQPQPQQPQALMQPFSTMQLHSYMAGSPAGIYYQQTPQGPYMGPYMTGMIQSWPTPTTAMDPGLIMQNNGLQPQHVRTPLSRPHLIPTGAGAQHRFNNSRPQRMRQSNLERSASERPSERPPVVSVTGSSRSSPRGIEGSAPVAVAAQGAYLPRRTATGREDMTPQGMSQQQSMAHQFVTPLVAPHQQQQHLASSSSSAAMVGQVAMEQMAMPHYQATPQHHQQSVIVHTAPAHTSVTPQTASNPPPPSTQQQMHHHHHSLPPPMLPPQQHHHQQQQQMVHHHQQQQQHQNHHPTAQHSSQHHQQPPPQPPPQTLHHQQQPQQAVHHHHHSHPNQHSMMASHHQHHHSPQQQHHPLPPSQLHHQQQQHQQPPLGNNRTERRGRRKREDSVRNQRSERNQSNRASFGSQTPVAADNFTMEANSFPPLPGALNSIASLEISYESRMSDIVRGVSRLPGLGNSGTQRASSNTPSPVPTPVPLSLTSAASVGQHHHGVSASVTSDTRSLDDGDSPLDDDATSSSQDDVDTDVNSAESRSVRSEPQSLSYAAEPSALPAHPRSQKASTPGASPASVSAQRQTEGRQGSVPTPAYGRGGQQYQVSPVVVSAATSAFEAPKLSYAQILALKNREAANSAGAVENATGVGPPLNTNSGTPNGPGSSAHSNNNAVQTGGGSGRASNQPSNAFREQGTYPGGQQQQQQTGFRSSQRSSAKDLPRSEGSASSRPPNGSRRNSKENRTSSKFDRRKPEARQK